MRNILIFLFICSQSYSFSQDYLKLKNRIGNIDTSYVLKVIDIYPHLSDMRQSERKKHKSFDPIYCYVKFEHNNRTMMLSYDKFNDESYLFLTNRINSVYDSLDVITKREHIQLMRKLEVQDSLLAIELKKAEQRDSLQRIADKNNRIKRIANLERLFGKSNAKRILSREIWIGMTRDMLIESWGRPNNIKESVGSWGNNEMFIYNQSKYVHLKNGIVSSWSIYR